MYSFYSRVRYSEIASDRKLSLVSIINYFQDCCTFEAEDGGVGLAWLADLRTSWMLTGWQIKINRRPDYCEKIKITTWACGFKLFRGKRNFTIESESGEILVYAFSDWAYVNIDTGVPARNVPQKELDVYGMKEPMEADFEKGKIRIPEEMVKVSPIVVTSDKLDTNNHVNNAQYIALALRALYESLESDKEEACGNMKAGAPGIDYGMDDISDFRAEYRMQSRAGDVIYPYVGRDGDHYAVLITDENGCHKLVARFTK